MMERSVSSRVAIYAGSFSPPTNGHMDIIERGAKLYDRLVVAVMANPDKRYLFSPEHRVDMLRRCLAHLPNVAVVQDGGLLIDLAKREGAGVILRGVRSAADLEYEMQLAVANRSMSGVETVFLPASPQYGHLSSTIVNGFAMHGGDIRGMVPDAIVADVMRVHQK